MPTISMFYGIIVRMYSEKGTKHHQPHIHCAYGEEELLANWLLLRNGEGYLKIELLH